MKRVILSIKQIMFILGLLPFALSIAKCQEDLAIRITDADVNQVLAAAVFSRSLNVGDYNETFLGEGYYINVDGASFHFLPNQRASITANIVATEVFHDWVIGNTEQPLHINGAYMEGDLILRKNESGFKLFFHATGINLGIYSLVIPTSQFLNKFSEVDLNVGWSLLPNFLASSFTSDTPTLATSSGNLALYYTVNGPRQINAVNQIGQATNWGNIEEVSNNEVLSSAQSPRKFWWDAGSTHELQTKDDVVLTSSDNYKYKYWTSAENTNPIQELSRRKIGITVGPDANYTARFGNAFRVRLSPSLEGSNAGGAVTFDANTSPNIDTYELSYDENLLTHNIDANATPGFNNTSWFFTSWSDGNQNKNRNIQLNSDITLAANFKGSMISNSSSAFSNNSSRKIVRGADGYIHLVYESMGKVWYEKVTEGGQSISIKQISTNNGSNPAIEQVEGLAMVGIVYQEICGGYNTVRLSMLNTLTNSIITTTELGQTPQWTTTPLYPVIAGFRGGTEKEFVVLWVEMMAVYPSGTGGIFMTRGTYNTGTSTISLLTTYNPSIPMNGTNSNSRFPTIARDVYGPQSLYYIAWQQRVDGTHSRILYRTLNTGYNPVILSDTTNLSKYCGMQNNLRPCITSVPGPGSRICWIADDYGTGTMTVFNDPGNPYMFWNFGNNVTSASVNSSADRYVIGWSQGNANYMTDNRSLRTVKNFQVTGSDMQVTNGATSTSMYAMAYNSMSSPYRVQLSNNVNSFGKNVLADVADGRYGILVKDQTQFLFGFGDICVDNNKVGLMEVYDSTKIASLNDINKVMQSDAFTITDASTLNYVVQYGTSDSLLAIATLGKDGGIQCQTELIDAESNQVIGVYGKVSVTGHSVKRFVNSGYRLSVKGVKSKLVKLRMVISDNISPVYALTNKFAPSNAFLKKDQEMRNGSFEDATGVLDYALGQNYPNPFNPATTISYVVKNAGLVSIKVYDMLGKEVQVLVNEYKNPGEYIVNFDASSLSSGMYLYKITTGNYSVTKKMHLVK